MTFFEDFTGEWHYDPTGFQDVSAARLCVGCEQAFYPPPCPADTAFACGGGYPLGDMRLAYCGDRDDPESCIAKAFAERDAFYEQCMAERQIKCQLEGHFLDLDGALWVTSPAPVFCHCCGEYQPKTQKEDGTWEVTCATMPFFSMRGIGVPA